MCVVQQHCVEMVGHVLIEGALSAVYVMMAGLGLNVNRVCIYLI